MPRPIILGVVGDSAAGKTTITRGLVRLLGDEHVTHIAADDYHRFDRRQRAERAITPLHPDCNYLDIMEQDLAHVRGGRAILKPVYQHKDGTFGPAVYVEPRQFTVVEGLLGYHTQTLRDSFDVRVFLAPPEDLRRHWADIVVSFMPGDRGDQEHLDAQLTLRDGLGHPDLSAPINGDGKGMRLREGEHERHLWIPGDIDAGAAAEVEEAIWDRMHFASHLRSERLGEFTIATELHRSESLAIVQLLVLYHLVTARASVALGAAGSRVDREPVRGAPQRISA